MADNHRIADRDDQAGEWQLRVELRQSFDAAVNTIVHSRTFRQTRSEGSHLISNHSKVTHFSKVYLR